MYVVDKEELDTGHVHGCDGSSKEHTRDSGDGECGDPLVHLLEDDVEPQPDGDDAA